LIQFGGLQGLREFGRQGGRDGRKRGDDESKGSYSPQSNGRERKHLPRGVIGGKEDRSTRRRKLLRRPFWENEGRRTSLEVRRGSRKGGSSIS